MLVCPGDNQDNQVTTSCVFTCPLCWKVSRAFLGWPSESHWRDRNPFRDGPQVLWWQGLGNSRAQPVREPAAGLQFEFVGFFELWLGK